MKHFKKLLAVAVVAGALAGSAYSALAGSPYDPNANYSWATGFSCTKTVGSYTSSFSCNNWADAYLSAVGNDSCEDIVAEAHHGGYSCTVD